MKFKGVMPALVTPLTKEEKLNVPVLCTLVEDLLMQGADGFYIGGASGEGVSLNRETRECLAESVIEQVGHRKPCIVHIASIHLQEALSLARHAEKCGAEGISAIPPLYFSYDEEDIYGYYKAIAKAVHIPVMIYYNQAAGLRFTAKMAARLYEIENVTSIKWTSSDYFEMMLLKDFTHGEMNIMNGCDEMLLMGLNAGADGGIGLSYNFMLPKIKAIYDNFIREDQKAAQDAQREANRVIQVLAQYALIPATKVILEGMGYQVGNGVFPMKRYGEEEKEVLLNKIRAVGL